MAPVVQGFWSPVPQLFSAWTWCLTKVQPPQLSYSWNTFLDTPPSHTVAWNTRTELTGCFTTTPSERQRLVLAFSCQNFHDICLSWIHLECQVLSGTYLGVFFRSKDFFLVWLIGLMRVTLPCVRYWDWQWDAKERIKGVALFLAVRASQGRPTQRHDGDFKMQLAVITSWLIFE